MTEPALQQEQHDHIFVSWSQLRAHDECKQKAYLYRQRRRSPGQDIRMFFPGTVVDRIMREWLDNEAREPGMHLRVSEVMDREETTARESGDGIVRWKNQSDRREVHDTCVELLARLEPILTKLVLPHEFEPAKRFRVPLTVPGPHDQPVTVTLNGEMDLLVRENGADWCVYDLKATRNEDYWRKTIMQLVFYDLAVRAGFGSYSKRLALIQPLCKQPIVVIEASDDLRRQLVQRIIAMVHDRVREDFSPKPDEAGCSWCDVRHACLKFKPVNGRMSLLA